MIKKIIFIVSIVSSVLLTFLTIDMLPIIFSSSWQGICLLVSVIFLLILEIQNIITNQELKQDRVVHNSCIILIAIYFSIIYYKVYSNYAGIYYDYSYCKNNYFFVSLLLFLLSIRNLFLKRKN